MKIIILNRIHIHTLIFELFIGLKEVKSESYRQLMNLNALYNENE